MLNRRSHDPETNFPNVLSYITQGKLATFGDVQCALAIHPSSSPAGQPFEALLLVQNMLDCDMDVRVRIHLLPRDASGFEGAFFAKTDRILIGLAPAEVGVMRLPVSSSPLTTPTSKGGAVLLSLDDNIGSGKVRNYVLGVEVRTKRKGRRSFARSVDSPVSFDPARSDMNEALRAQIHELHRQTYYDRVDRKHRLLAAFGIKPSVGPAPLDQDLSPDWQSLWTKQAHIDEEIVVREMREKAHAEMLPKLTRTEALKPLMQAVQSRFQAAGYPLETGEALFAAKLLALTLEKGEELGPELPRSRCFVRVCRLLYMDERAPQLRPDFLVTKLLWDDLVMDATILGFSMVAAVARTTLHELLGKISGTRFKAGEVEGVIQTYGQQLVRALSGEESARSLGMSFTNAYMPLILGGLVANTLVTMPRESALDSIHMFKSNLDERQSEQTAQNKVVFQVAYHLLERGFDLLA